jgi:hypothetical protein
MTQQVQRECSKVKNFCYFSSAENFKIIVNDTNLRQQSAGRATAPVLPYWGRSGKLDPEKSFNLLYHEWSANDKTKMLFVFFFPGQSLSHWLVGLFSYHSIILLNSY